MYPDFHYLFRSLFHIDIPALSFLKTFGFFVALGFSAAAWLLKSELQRMEAAGWLQPKLLPIDKAKKYLSGSDRHTTQPVIPVYPHQRVGEIVVLALVGGVIGAKVFNALESWKDFISDPVGSLLSGSGLTFYGGLIVAALLIYLYCKRHKIGVAYLCDAASPALMLAYAIGRLGCHFAGDGDWGIFNSAYASGADGSVEVGSLGQFQQAVTGAPYYFIENFGTTTAVPHATVAATDWLPRWMYAMNFVHNINNDGIAINGCSGTYCHMLPVPVFPTSFYEAVICMLLFVLLWALRNRFKYALHLFGFYLVLNGIERFLIEQVKVNYKYDWGFIHPAQSEIIALMLVVAGLLILLFYRKHPIYKRDVFIANKHVQNQSSANNNG